MSEEISLEEYKKAYREIVLKDEKKDFITHLIIFVLTVIIITVINFTTDFLKDIDWIFYLFIIWGFFVLMHYLYNIHWTKRNLIEREGAAEYRAKKLKNQ